MENMDQTSELLKAMQEMMDVNQAKSWLRWKPTMRKWCQGWKPEATALEANSAESESTAEHQEVPKENAAEKPVGALKKQHRDQHLVVGWRGQPEETTRGNCGAWKKLAATRRRMTRCTGVAQCKGRCHQGHGRDYMVRGTPKGQPVGRRHQPKPKCRNGIRDWGLTREWSDPTCRNLPWFFVHCKSTHNKIHCQSFSC
jgi:hypothetical protein